MSRVTKYKSVENINTTNSPLLLPDEYSSVVDEAWLDLGDTSQLQLDNPFDKYTDEDVGLRLMKIWSDPNYFAYTCKVLLNINLLPEQAAILKILWEHAFPMFVASRGAGKSFLLAVYSTLRCLFIPRTKVVICGAAYRQSKIIFEYMENIWQNAPMMRDVCTQNSGPRRDIDRCIMYINDSMATALPIGDGCLKSLSPLTLRQRFSYIGHIENTSSVWGNGKFNEFDEHYDNGLKPTKIITTRQGYSFEGTYNHRMKVLRNQNIDWVRADEMKVGDRILIDRSYRWHEGDFECSEDQAYALGLMISDGHWTNPYRIGFATEDKELVLALNQGIDNADFRNYSDEIHYTASGKQIRRAWLKFWDMKKSYTPDKILPTNILSASRSKMTACIQGLFDGDGHVQIYTEKGGTAVAIGFTNTSELLIKQIQYILLHYGIISNLSSRIRDIKNYRVWELLIIGQNAVKFAKEIGFRLKRKQEVLLSGISHKIRTTEVINTIPDVKNDMIRIATEYKGLCGGGNISISKIEHRKQMTFSFIKSFLEKYKNVDDPFIARLNNLCNEDIYYDEIVDIRNSECHTYDIHVPEIHEYCAGGFFSHNSKIRGIRANVIIMDEFSATSPDIYETVISGFAAVSADPLANVKLAAGRKKKKELGLTDGVDNSRVDGKKFNQSILSGTADYSFKHFAKYWDRYRKIVNSNGQHDQMKELFTDGVIPRNFDYRDYAVIRFPYELIPEGFMDDAIVTRAKATMNSSTYNLEYGTIFVDDSDGFFKRSLIDSCVGTDINPIRLPSGDVYFDAKVYGMKDYNYVFAVDPASEVDNFSIVILELHIDHTRVVYCWTTNRERHKKYVKDGLTKEHDFYGFCSRKIRNLMKVFPCIKIAMDAQGGGRAIEESLHDPDKLELGELPIWTIEDPAKPAYGDGQPGLHILEMIQFRKTDWVMEANHGMKKDLEDKVLLFPRFDALTLEMAMVQDNTRVGTVYDTLEDCCMEIEELKNELCTIIHSTTGPGVGAVDRWDTPETKQPNGKKGRMRKDRYSALLMANMAARQMMRTPPPISYGAIGGFTKDIYTTEKGPLYTGPAWFTEGENDDYFGVVRH